MQKPIVFLLIATILVLGLLYFTLPKSPKKTTPTPTPIQRTEVILNQNGFTPATLTIKKGQAVRWVNQSGRDATVNSDPHPTHNLNRFLNLGQFPSGNSVQAIFNTGGKFDYHNHLNPSQKGSIVVE